MVVKSATKKKLMDMQIPEEYAHLLADDRKWDDVKILTAQEIAAICKTDSDTGTKLHTIIISATGSRSDSSDSQGGTTVVRRRAAPRRHLRFQQRCRRYGSAARAQAMRRRRGGSRGRLAARARRCCARSTQRVPWSRTHP